MSEASKILFTSDWQASWGNLDKIKIIVSQIFSTCQEQGITHVVHGGDVKHQYNPIDVRIVNYMVGLCKRFTKRGISFYINRGNHDRVGMSADSADWFPALKAAGAIVIDQPRVIQVGSATMYALPYMVDPEQAKDILHTWAAKAQPDNSFLVFHNELKNCRANVAMVMKDCMLQVKDMRPSKYMACFGGHIHLHQKMGDNVYYIGSPFAQDWTEVNQHKGSLILHTKTSQVTFIKSLVPGYHDPSMPQFKETKPLYWTGSSVRVHIAYDKSSPISIQTFLHRATRHAEKQYPGADIVAVPEFLEATADPKAIMRSGQTDDEAIAAYVKETCPPSIQNKKAVTAYLVKKLMEVGGVRRSAEAIRLLSGEAKNFLSFKDVKVDYSQPGITVVTGQNKDWPNRNNGSGKTNFLQIPAVALFGKSLKRQSAEDWVRDTAPAKQPAYVKLRFKLRNGKKCTVFRGRRPVKLRLTVDGQDHSTGIGIKGTQAAIESLTGMTWESITNSMYVNQGEVSKLLTGTDAERKVLFVKFLNLERFSKARELVKEQIDIVDKQLSDVEDDINVVTTKRQQMKEALVDFQVVPLPTADKRLQETRRKWQAATAVAEKLRQDYRTRSKEIAEQVEKISTKLDEFKTEYARSSARADLLDSAIHDMQGVATEPICPTCRQKVDKNVLKKKIESTQKQIAELEATLTDIKPFRKSAQTELDKLAKEAKQLQASVNEAEGELTEAKAKYYHVKEVHAEAKLQEITRQKYKKRIKRLRQELDQLKEHRSHLKDEYQIEKYCLSAFGKDGIPAYLTAEMCPRLNAAAKRYSRIFSEEELQVQFTMTEQDIDVVVINLHGGKTLSDQSGGETRIVGIITAFAIHDVMSPCNVLILDEPGESLDSENAKVFAEGLKRAAKKFKTVLLTTHNPYILGELSGERTIQITKRKRISIAASV